MGQQFSLKKATGKVGNLFKAIIFDLDGTLVDLKVDWKSLKNKLGNTFQKEFQYLHEEIGKLETQEKEKAFQIIRKYELENLEKWKINTFFINWIIQNSDKKIVCVLSNNTKSTIEKFLFKTNLTSHISKHITLDDVNKAKPDDEGFDKIRNYFNLELNEIILIGDSKHDEIIAKKNKIKFCISNWLENENFNKIINDFK
jgi:HAD superfamily hydrolase (TIGR01549 family)